MSNSFTSYARSKWTWAIGLFLLLLVSATAYGMVWYHRFYHHLTVQEISHEVQHSTFQTTIRGGTPVTLQIYQQSNAVNQPLVLFTSGDGGWSPFCADIAAHLAATGRTVVGFNVKDYLVTFASSQKPVTPEELTSDYESIINSSLTQPGVAAGTRATLAGWSIGAGYSVLMAVEPRLNGRVGQVIAISLPIYNELAWKPTDALIYFTHGTPHEKVFDTRKYLPELGSTPISMINATKDDTSPYNEAQSLAAFVKGPKEFYTVQAEGHHFEGGENELYHSLDQALLAGSSLTKK
jgi:pimeloyl-ACP methyl ester carboxylesterase